MKKKIALICLFLVSASISVKAQTDTIQYDTLVYYPQEVAGCPTWIDSFDIASIDYRTFLYQFLANDVCCKPGTQTIPVWDIVGPNTLAKGFAQHYSLPDTAKICGIAARVFGDIPSNPFHNCYFWIGNFNSTNAAYVQIPVFNPSPYTGISASTHLQPIPRHYLNRTIDLKDFWIMADSLVIEEWNNLSVGNEPYTFDYGCTLDYDPCDTSCTYIWQMPDGPNYHIGCDVKESPIFHDRNSGQWKHFEDDTIYVHYRRMFIAWYPILLIPHMDTSSISTVDVSSICNIFPNPASTYLKLVSELKVKRIEIYSMTGVKVREEEVNEFQKAIDISSLPVGSYVMNIYTTQGKAEKKFVKE